MINEAIRAPLRAEEIVSQSERHIDDFLDGGSDLEAEDIQSAIATGVDPGVIEASWAHAKTLRPNGLKPGASFILPSTQPRMAATENLSPAPFVRRRLLETADAPTDSIKGNASSEAPVPLVSGGPAAVAMDRRALGFQHSRSPTGIPASLENAMMAINALEIDCRYDVFHDRIIVKGHECGLNGDVLENLENVTLKVRQAVLSRFGFDPSANFTFDALRLRCLDRVFDPVRDYLDGLSWDGTPRLDNWLVRYCGADDTALNRAIGRKMLIAAVRRVRTPGCKFDYIVVLEGAQGVGKSTLLKLLAGEENFTDNEIIGLDKREQQESIQGIWIYEIAELDGLHKSDVTKVKLFASKTVDSARPAYGRNRVDRPRRGIFIATTNEDTYLRDTTGNRRFWPVRVGKVDLAAIAKDRDQLWAEASAIEASGEPLVIDEALWADAADQQSARMELDPWEDVLACRLAELMQHQRKIDGSFMLAGDNVGNPEWRVASDFLLTDILGLAKERQFQNHTKRLAGIMRTLGWIRHDTPIRIGKQVKRGFVKPKTAGASADINKEASGILNGLLIRRR